MTEYRVTWIIDIEASHPEEAARKALAIQRDNTSTATVFTVDADRHGNPAEVRAIGLVDVDLNPDLM